MTKIANRLGKTKPELNGVFVMQPPYPLDQIAVENVWGIGRRLAQRLRLMGIGIAQDLAHMDCMTARKTFSVVLERTPRGLLYPNGRSAP